MKKLYTLFLPLLLLGTKQMVNAQTSTRFYLQDFGNVGNYSPTSQLTNYYNTNTGTNSNYSYNAIFNAGSANGVKSANLQTNPPTTFTNYGVVSPSSTPADGNFNITQYIYQSTSYGTYNTAGYGTVCWDKTTGGANNIGANVSPAPAGLLMFVNANKAKVGKTGGTYFELPLSVLNIPGATYTASLWWRDFDGTSDYSSLPVPAFVGIDVNTGSKGSGTSLANVQNPASALSLTATAAQKNAVAPRTTVSTAWQQLTTTFTLQQSFTGNILYVNVYNSDPGFNNDSGNDLGVDDIELDIQTIASLGGTVYTNDGTGAGTSTTTYQSSGANQLYAVLVDQNNKVIQSVPVGTDGTYSFVTNAATNQYIPYAAGNIGMNILLSTTNPAVGTANFSTSSLPASMANTGHNYPGQTFISDKTDAIMSITQTSSNAISGANFYIENRPTANNVTVTNVAPWQYNVSGSTIGQSNYVGIITNTPPAQPLSGGDIEDGTISLFQIGTIGAGTLLYYNGVKLNSGNQITNYDPSKLVIYVSKTAGATGPSFTYYTIDKAGALSAVANYSLSSPNTLPVTLANYVVKSQNCAGIVSWTGAVENNFNYYEVQQSTDNNNFTAVEKIYGKGSGNSYQSQFALTAYNEYIRLKMVDNSGAVTYSDIQAISSNCIENAKPSLYPNPVSNKLTIDNLGVASKNIIVTSVVGQVIYKNQTSATQVKIDVQNWVAGIYFVSIKENNGKNNTFKIVKQ